MLKFANNDKSKLCCASNDGTLSICDVLTSPPCVKAILRCHTGPVTGKTKNNIMFLLIYNYLLIWKNNTNNVKQLKE